METLSLTWALGHVQSHTSGFQPKFSYLKWTTSWEGAQERERDGAALRLSLPQSLAAALP
jgi:hypothetical protein